MRALFGLLLGAFTGALFGMFAVTMGFDAGKVIGANLGPIGAAWAGGIFGGIIGILIYRWYRRGADENATRGEDAMLGAMGGAFTGALYGLALGAIGGALILIIHAQVIGDDRSSEFAGALGGSVIGALTGAVAGLTIGVLSGLVVGLYAAFLGKSSPEPAEASATVAGEKKQASAASARAPASAPARQSPATQPAARPAAPPPAARQPSAPPQARKK